MAHINGIPPELLSHIFSILLGLVDEEMPPRLSRMSYELLDCLLVCQRWNQVICATASLWTTVYVTHGAGALPRVQRYLKRSGTLPLDIVVASVPRMLRMPEVEDALQVLREYPARWNTFSASSITSRMHESLGVTLPNLISFSYPDPLPLPVTASPITLDVPKLESCTAHADTVFFRNDSWPALKHLDIQYLEGIEPWVWSILGTSQSSLEFLVFRSDETIWMDDRRFKRSKGHGKAVSSLTSLKRLEVHALSDGLWSILRFAAMPILASLTLDLDFFDAKQEHRALLPTLDSLELLHVHTYSCLNVADNIILLLERAPSVTSFIATDKSGQFADRNEDMLTPLLLTSVKSPGEPLVGRSLQDVHLLRVPTSVQRLKELVDLRAGYLRKVVLTQGWDVVRERPTASPDVDDELLAWLKIRVVLEEIEGEWD